MGDVCPCTLWHFVPSPTRGKYPAIQSEGHLSPYF